MLRTSVLFILILSLGCVSTTNQNQYEAAISKLKLGTPATETDAAVKLLESGGIGAFDALVAHLDDETNASDLLMGDVGYIDAAPAEPFHVSIGYACFDILQFQIEGCWPKSYRQYYVLTDENIRGWLSNRKTKTLGQLRIECAERSLEVAERTNRENPTEHSKDSVSFLTDNLNKVRAANENAE